MSCQICHLPLTEETVTTTVLVCRHKHGGTSPKIGQTVPSCQTPMKGSIWVHVIDDAGTEIPDIPVTFPDGSAATKQGFASSGPLKDGTYTAAIGQLPETYLPLAVTSADDVPVEAGQITRVQFQLIRAATMTVTVKLADPDAAGFVPGVQVQVTGSGDTPPEQPTLNSGSTEFEKLHPGAHQVSITFDQDKYWIKPGDEQQTWDVKPAQPNNVEFTLTPLVWIKVAILSQTTDVQPTGKLKLKLLDATETTKNFPDSNPVEFPGIKKVAGTCSIEEVNFDGDELYEFVK